MVGIVGSVLSEEQKRLINNPQSSTSASTTTSDSLLSDQGAPGSESLTVPSGNEAQLTTTGNNGSQASTTSRWQTRSNSGEQEPQSPGYDPETIDIGGSEVSDRVNEITSKDSPLMQRARTSARQSSNRRGLVNSSMAAGAGERAVIDAATPIASKDAQLGLQAEQANQQAVNQMRSQRLAGTQNLQQLNAQTDSQMQLNEQQAVFDQAMQTMRGDQAERIAGIEARAQQLSQASQSASVIYSQSAAAIGNILANPDIPVDQKGQLIEKQYELLDGSLAFISQTGNVDLTGIVDGDGSGGGNGGGGAGDGTEGGPGGPTPDTGTGGGPGGRNPGGQAPGGGDEGVSLQEYRQMVEQSLENAGGWSMQGEQANEQFINDIIGKAIDSGVGVSKMFSAVSEHFPDVGYNQFIDEIRARGYEVGPNTNWKIASGA